MEWEQESSTENDETNANALRNHKCEVRRQLGGADVRTAYFRRADLLFPAWLTRAVPPSHDATREWARTARARRRADGRTDPDGRTLEAASVWHVRRARHKKWVVSEKETTRKEGRKEERKGGGGPLRGAKSCVKCPLSRKSNDGETVRLPPPILPSRRRSTRV